MASLKKLRDALKQLLTEYAQIPTYDSELEYITIFDLKSDRYMLISIGWYRDRRVHDCIMHLDIIDGQIWIQANNTDRYLAEELVAAGIPPQSIVLGLQPPEVRKFTAYGVQKSESSKKTITAS
ncbi:MAG: XisI protein [Cyanobacteriota bacterium]|nr:XisI protein [Cyanobacteriota bacterium]